MKTASARRHSRGMTLVELMVALVIGLMVSAVVFTVMLDLEGRRRTITASADLDQSATLAMFQLDRWLRSAGTGFVSAASYAFGCELHAQRGSQRILPAAAALTAPFDKLNPGAAGVFRFAPALILPGQTLPRESGQASDVLILMGAGATTGQAPTAFAAGASSAQLALANGVAFKGGDLVLLADQNDTAGGNVAPCAVTQVKATFTRGSSNLLPLDGSYFSDPAAGQSLANYGESALNLGGETTAVPSLMVVGVGDNNTLFSYDLLQIGTTPLQARAEGVFEMHALYGVDSDNDGKVDAWQSPSSARYGVAALSAGNAAAAGLLRSIKAIRVGLLMRSLVAERDIVSDASLSLFSDLGDDTLTFTRTLTDAEQHYRYRAVEATIPLRNALL